MLLQPVLLYDKKLEKKIIAVVGAIKYFFLKDHRFLNKMKTGLIIIPHYKREKIK